MDDDDFDIDNMDFEAGLVPAGSGSGPSHNYNQQQKEKAQVPRQNVRGWSMIYPVYIDRARSTNKGRLVGKEFCVDEPVAPVMAECCHRLGLSTVFEGDKRHPKDPLVFGRIRIKLFRDGGDKSTFINTKFKTKIDVLKAISEVYEKIYKELIEDDDRVKSVIEQSRSKIPDDLQEIIENAIKGPKGKSAENENSSGTSTPTVAETPKTGRVVPSKKKNKKKKK